MSFIAASAAGAKDVRLSDFLPDWSGSHRSERASQSDESMIAALRSLASQSKKGGTP